MPERLLVAHKQLVAVVDDDVVVLSGLSNHLRSLGYRVLTFTSAEAFLSAPEVRNFCCVISDIQMPGGMSGFELRQALWTRACDLPVVLMTGDATEAARARAREIEASGFIEKPVDSEALIELLEAACRDDDPAD